MTKAFRSLITQKYNRSFEVLQDSQSQPKNLSSYLKSEVGLQQKLEKRDPTYI